MGFSSWNCKELDMTERLTLSHFVINKESQKSTLEFTLMRRLSVGHQMAPGRGWSPER